MESYNKRKRKLEEKYGKLIVVKPINNEGIKNNINENYIRKIADITDEEGLNIAYKQKDGLHQHYNKLFIAGTKDFPQDHIDDLKLPFDDTLKKTKRGRDAESYYLSHHEIDTVIGHSLGGAVALSLEKQYKKEGDNPYGLIQSKTYGAPVVSGNVGSSFGEFGKTIVKNGILDLGTGVGAGIGASVDSTMGFVDGGLLTGLGADMGNKLATDLGNRLTEDTNTQPDRIRYFGDPISVLDFNATTVFPSFKHRWKNSAHSYVGLEIADKTQIHDTQKNPLNPSGSDVDSIVITE